MGAETIQDAQVDAASQREQQLEIELTKAARAALARGPVGAYLMQLLPKHHLRRLGVITEDEVLRSTKTFTP